jgi:hypothetical protein
MNTTPRYPHALAAVALAAALLAACGGSDDDDSDRALPNAAQRDTDDEADAATVQQAGSAFARVDRDARTRGLPSLYAADSREPAQAAGAQAERFPGVKQTHLVASTPAYGAQIVEPQMKNAWGIAIRPAGLGGHFWIGASNSAKSIQYVGDVGEQPLFQDELAVVDTRGPVSGVAFNPGTGFTITQPHPNGPITAGTKFFFANLSGTVSA